MIRSATLIWLILAAPVGIGLFHLKYEVRAMEEELARLNHAIIAEQEAIRVLEAEWSYLNRPQRLSRLSERYLDLVPVAATQIGRIRDVPLRPQFAATEPPKAGPRRPAIKPPYRPLLAASGEVR